MARKRQLCFIEEEIAKTIQHSATQFHIPFLATAMFYDPILLSFLTLLSQWYIFTMIYGLYCFLLLISWPNWVRIVIISSLIVVLHLKHHTMISPFLLHLILSLLFRICSLHPILFPLHKTTVPPLSLVCNHFTTIIMNFSWPNPPFLLLKISSNLVFPCLLEVGGFVYRRRTLR